MKRFLFVCLALLLAVRTPAAEADGPYVMRNAAGKLESWLVELAPEGARKRALPVAVGQKIAVPAVGAAPAFEVRLRANAKLAPDTVSAGAKLPLFVVADTHGEYEILVGMLTKQKVLDERLRWNLGRGRLLFLGDVFDRGPHQLEILWLIYELEAQARAAGGAVYFVLGNHEVMTLRGDHRYLNPKYNETAQLLGVAQYSALFDAGSVLGQWLRSKPTVLKLDDNLCLHGGVSRELVDRRLTLKTVNTAVRAVLAGQASADSAPGDFLLGETGPLWYRGYFADFSRTPAPAGDIAAIRNFFGVNRVLVGHTQMPTITPLYDGQVIAVQVYPRLDSFGNASFEALWIRDGKLLRARPDGSTEELR